MDTRLKLSRWYIQVRGGKNFPRGGCCSNTGRTKHAQPLSLLITLQSNLDWDTRYVTCHDN